MVVYKAQILQSMHPRAVYYLWLRHKNLREIAQCMHIIAMAGLHKLNGKSGQKHSHFYFIKELFKGLCLNSVSDIVSSSEINSNDYETDITLNTVNRFLIIYITSDKSCSGLINGGVFKLVNSLVQAITIRYKSVRLISIGKKGFTFFRRRFKSKFFKVFMDLDSEKNSFLVCVVIVYKFMKLKFDKGLVIFNRYINAQSQIVSYYNFFSFPYLLKKMSYEQHKNKLFRRLTTMNKVDDYSLVDLYRFSMCIVLLDSLKENFFSETAARARVMENIMQNLDVLINLFWINYQKARQRRITDEIIEILNGANVANEYSVDARNEALEHEKKKYDSSVSSETDSIYLNDDQDLHSSVYDLDSFPIIIDTFESDDEIEDTKIYFDIIESHSLFSEGVAFSMEYLDLFSGDDDDLFQVHKKLTLNFSLFNILTDSINKSIQIRDEIILNEFLDTSFTDYYLGDFDLQKDGTESSFELFFFTA